MTPSGPFGFGILGGRGSDDEPEEKAWEVEVQVTEYRAYKVYAKTAEEARRKFEEEGPTSSDVEFIGPTQAATGHSTEGFKVFRVTEI